MIQVGDFVTKVTGYVFPGKVLSVFTTSSGATRYVVEMYLFDDPTGLLHIFNREQLAKVD